MKHFKLQYDGPERHHVRAGASAGAGVCTCTTCRYSRTIENEQARNLFLMRTRHVILGSMALANIEVGHG